MASFLVVVGLLAAGFLALGFGAQRGLLFPRRGAPGFDIASRIPGLEQVGLGPGGGVEAWFLPPHPEAVTGEAAPSLIFGHGNGELIDDWAGEFEAPRSWGMGVLLVEYPGYGRSRGSPSQASIAEVFAEAHDYLAGRPGLDPRRIVGYGRSLGGGAVCTLLPERPPAALILESSFTSVRGLAARMGMPGFLVRDPFDNLAVLEGYPGPVLLIHGRHDEMIPADHARRLHAATSRSELLLLPCGHNDCPRSWPRIRDFLEGAGLLP